MPRNALRRGHTFYKPEQPHRLFLGDSSLKSPRSGRVLHASGAVGVNVQVSPCLSRHLPFGPRRYLGIYVSAGQTLL